MRPIIPDDLTQRVIDRAGELNVAPEQYRRWERGERVAEVEVAMIAETDRLKAASAPSRNPG